MGEPPALRRVHDERELGGCVVDALLYSFLHALPRAGQYERDLTSVEWVLFPLALEVVSGSGQECPVHMHRFI